MASQENNVLLITGASGGIGAEIARLSIGRGYTVGVHYRCNETVAEELVDSLGRHGVQAAAFQADLAKESEVERLFASVSERFGPVSGLVNNAGALDRIARLDELTGERIERLLRINVLGPLLCAREAVKQMSPRHGGEGGAIVNISSVAAKLGSPSEFVDYAATKGAIDTFTVGLAKEVAGEGIRVNAVRPGLILTPMHAHSGNPDRANDLKGAIPMQRPGLAAEVAKSVMWLLSEEASYVTGAILDVSGGR